MSKILKVSCLSRALGSRPQRCRRASSNLIALGFSAYPQQLSRFGANFLRISNLQPSVKLLFLLFLLFCCLPFRTQGSQPRETHSRKKLRTAQNLKYLPAQHAPEPLRLAGKLVPGSCNGLFSVGFPTGVLRSAAAHSSDPTNQLPHSTLGQAHRPPGSSTAHFQLC